MATPPDRRLAAVLEEVANLREALQELEFQVVHLCRELGMTWERIGEAHPEPISRVRAAKRYSHPKPSRQGRE